MYTSFILLASCSVLSIPKLLIFLIELFHLCRRPRPYECHAAFLSGKRESTAGPLAGRGTSEARSLCIHSSPSSCRVAIYDTRMTQALKAAPLGHLFNVLAPNQNHPERNVDLTFGRPNRKLPSRHRFHQHHTNNTDSALRPSASGTPTCLA